MIGIPDSLDVLGIRWLLRKKLNSDHLACIGMLMSGLLHGGSKGERYSRIGDVTVVVDQVIGTVETGYFTDRKLSRHRSGCCQVVEYCLRRLQRAVASDTPIWVIGVTNHFHVITGKSRSDGVEFSDYCVFYRKCRHQGSLHN